MVKGTYFSKTKSTLCKKSVKLEQFEKNITNLNTRSEQYLHNNRFDGWQFKRFHCKQTKEAYSLVFMHVNTSKFKCEHCTKTSKKIH